MVLVKYSRNLLDHVGFKFVSSCESFFTLTTLKSLRGMKCSYVFSYHWIFGKGLQ